MRDGERTTGRGSREVEEDEDEVDAGRREGRDRFLEVVDWIAQKGMKRRSDEALSDLCETCEHYHACGTTCEECGHVRGGESTTTTTTTNGGGGDGVGKTSGSGTHERAIERSMCVEVIERFLLIGAFEHTANERALVANGVRTVINAVPSCPPCCSGRHLSVITLSTVEQGEESEDGGRGASKKRIDLRHCCERLKGLHVRSMQADETYPLRVLVYCMSGRSRAPSIAMAYMMYNSNMTLEQARTYIESRYPRGHAGVRLKDDDLETLGAFERELAEERSRQPA